MCWLRCASLRGALTGPEAGKCAPRAEVLPRAAGGQQSAGQRGAEGNGPEAPRVIPATPRWAAASSRARPTGFGEHYSRASATGWSP